MDRLDDVKMGMQVCGAFVAAATACLGLCCPSVWAAPATSTTGQHRTHHQRHRLQQQLRHWLSIQPDRPSILSATRKGTKVPVVWSQARGRQHRGQRSTPSMHRTSTATSPSQKAMARRRLARRAGRKVAEGDDLIPDIRPVAPLPKVFRKVRLSSQPSGVRVLIKAGSRVFDCLPANRTPCTFEATGQGSMNIDITVALSSGRSVRYRRAIEGSSVTVDVWLLKIPQASNNTAILRPRRIAGGQKTTGGGGAVRWLLIGGVVVIVGGAVAGIVYAVKSQENLSFRLRR